MAKACLLAVAAGLLVQVCGLAAEIQEGNMDVFVTQDTAHTVLRRQRRYNSGKLEEVLYKANLERECKEETCSMEEAREVFEDDEKTMEFWVGYIDGDQCKPQPCQNGGDCQDGVNSYVCWCKQGFNGKNCEIEIDKQCEVDNGGCSHFCVMLANQAVCRCATGHRLGADNKSCEPTEPFSCGAVSRTARPARPTPRPRSGQRTFTSDNTNYTAPDFNYDEDYITLEDYLQSMNVSDPINETEAVEIRSARSAGNESEATDDGEQLPYWAMPTLPTIVAQDNDDQRIVGGDEAIPGEIPWQVTLMYRPHPQQRAEPFCGGSLLSDVWIITAAHCLTQAKLANKQYFVRAGEHDVQQDEGPESDHTVLEEHLHPMYDFTISHYNHDIALLKLATPVELSLQRRPICLGPKDFTENVLREARTSLVSGWGRLKFQGLQATRLQKLQVPYVDRTHCKRSSSDHITRFMFCAGYDTQQMDSCQGDSGGPHATKFKDTWFLTGIVSWGEECAKDGKYGIYTRVSRYHAWIALTTGIRISN